jgi:hypothetical protein
VELMDKIIKNYSWQDIIRLSIEKNISIERMIERIIDDKKDKKKVLSLIDRKLKGA